MTTKERKIEYKEHPKHGYVMKYEGDLNWQICQGEDLEIMKKGLKNGQ